MKNHIRVLSVALLPLLVACGQTADSGDADAAPGMSEQGVSTPGESLESEARSVVSETVDEAEEAARKKAEELEEAARAAAEEAARAVESEAEGAVEEAAKQIPDLR